MKNQALIHLKIAEQLSFGLFLSIPHRKSPKTQKLMISAGRDLRIGKVVNQIRHKIGKIGLRRIMVVYIPKFKMA